MKSARHTSLRRLGTLVPTLALAVAGTLAAVTPSSTTTEAPRARAANFVNRYPIGDLDRLAQVPGGARATGWVFDPDARTAPVTVYATVDGKKTSTVSASRSRSDVAKAHPNAGAAHGFAFTVPVTEGRHDVCIVAVNVGKGRNVTLGCLRKTVFDYGPFGAINRVSTRPGHIFTKGWLVDADSVTAPVTARITIDGVAHDVVADKSRPDIATVRKGAGAQHGFAASLAAKQGKHTVCVIGRDIGYGRDNKIGCKSVTLDDDPISGLNSVAQSGNALRVRGWAFDRDDTVKPLTVSVRIDGGAARTYTASVARADVAKKYGIAAKHGFDQAIPLSEGSHTVCVSVKNIGYGADTSFACRRATLSYTPTAALTKATPTRTGLSVTGWATDPDTSAALPVRITLDGRTVATVTANGKGATHTGHNFAAAVTARSGRHAVCAIALNRGAGTHNSQAACSTQTLALSPIGGFNSLTRSGDDVRVTGWAFDPDSAAAATVTMTVDGKAAGSHRAAVARTDVAKVWPSAGANRGFAPVLATTDGKHTVCVTAKNVGGGKDVSLGCRLIIAVHPVVASAPRSVKASAGYGSLKVSWAAPASDGGAPPTKYVVTTSPAGAAVTLASTARSTTLSGLKANAVYRVTVTAVNVAGRSAGGVSAATRTATGPAPQTKPAPVSTSRYLRNIRTCSTSEKSVMRAFGAADARNNPSGHRYLMLLDIGGQNQRYGGVVLSATTRFVTYAALLSCSKSYVDGYASAQRATAPAMIAIGVNNDMDVNSTTGRAWATQIVNPLLSYARKYSGITVAGANDVEPGFRGSYSATRSWLSGYLAATKAKFVFNGSADGCAWTVSNRSCNNGYTMAGLYNLAGGAAPSRIINLPQVYNYTMADQWKYISLTGVGQGNKRINFGGPLTEYTACAQARSCGSIGGRSAWQRMWSDLQSHPKLRVGSLPYATDLRIDS
ncbi:Fibronectin type III domain-containing protein [Jatrophihabitans endophyticus]|uniref:Fibronectin type III domain-containing protein n=1 Tax=Jatrophihabitans endophyticus TaxID=1206085 RepID=A0A1M5RAJ8_9ACTN|nr:fibronectin type III domain-containing protein [Jatrophihabitans endophyticus]SHH23345.1 Fibronectin type III domain-containing protein [Jatrophihabitans endophyticus]